MSSVKYIVLLLVLGLTGCQDNLSPSSSDERPAVVTGIIGNQVGQIAPDFTLESSLNTFHTLSSELATHDGVVLYFTMWCPICDNHMSHMRAYIASYPNVQFLLVDYVNGSVTDARTSQVSSGYRDLSVLVDLNRTVENLYEGSMGTTIVVDRLGIVQMNQYYSDGRKLGQVLSRLL
ncbi:MAG: peroxiredoxin family protein [Candidatus Polarisedimenticolaceae bacterium]|nr:peroxiredoxin family protein [Candidatus Polarisedimenticolaceae bacterium]